MVPISPQNFLRDLNVCSRDMSHIIASGAPISFANCFDCMQYFRFCPHRDDVNETLVRYKKLAAGMSSGRFSTFLRGEKRFHEEVFRDSFVSWHPVIRSIVS